MNEEVSTMLERITDSYKLIEKALDASWLRNEAISQNIANVDTPNYKRRVVNFESFLNDAINSRKIKGFTTDSRHIKIGKKDIDSINCTVTRDYSNLSYRMDGNNVDIDAEMASMAQNSIKYYALINSMNRAFNNLKYVISEGRR